MKTFIQIFLACLLCGIGTISGQIRVYIPDTAASEGTILNMPVYTEDLTNQGIYSYEMELSVDSSKAEFQDIQLENTLSEDAFAAVNQDKDGHIHISVAHSQAFWNKGKLLKIGFKLKQPGLMEVNFLEFYFNEGNPSSTTDNGKIEILVNVNVPIKKGWNIVGMPVERERNRIFNLYPASIQNTGYGFKGSYTRVDSFIIGRGYWLQFRESSTATISGTRQTSIRTKLNKGWNLISGPSDTASWSSIVDTRNILVENTLFGFSNGYKSTNTLIPGKGYWIRAVDSAHITIQVKNDKSKPKPTHYPKGFVKLILKNEEGNTQSLLFDGTLPESDNIKQYTLPPLPPKPAFDARFSKNRRLLETDEAKVRVQGVNSHLSIKAKGVGEMKGPYAVKVGSNRQKLTASNTVSFTEGPFKQLYIKSINENAAVPDQYRLQSNVPNPFNPTTKITYHLPKTNQVELAVYDILGRKVTTLVKEQRKAGTYTVTFHADHLSSGVYIYRLETEQYSKSRKMLLTK